MNLTSYPNPRLTCRRFPPGVPGPNLTYRFCRRFLHLTVGTLWGVRVFNRRFEPAAGSALYISNHQSLMDPPLMSMALRRPVNYMARDALFRVPGFGRLIRAVNAFPVRRGSADTGALKEALRRLKAGGQLAVFPEGTRTKDGTIGPFLPGITMLAQRAADWVVPVVIDGAFECWPRTSLLPMPGLITVAYCQPLGRAEVQSMSGEELLAVVRTRMIEMQAELRRRTGRPAVASDLTRHTR